MSSWRLHVLVCLGLAMLTLGCLGRVCNCDFMCLDDLSYVVENRVVREGLTPATCGEAFTTFHGHLWIPMTWLSLQLDSWLYGYGAVAKQASLDCKLAEIHHRPLAHERNPLCAGAWGFHLTNLVLHLANVLLAYGVFFRMTGAVARSALVAALFAVHPLHVESVAWVTERKDVLSAFFFLLALWAYAGYVRKPTIARYVPVLLLAFLGMASKPMVVTLPAVLLLLDYWPLGRLDWGQARPTGPVPTISWKRALIEKVPLFALSLGSGLLTMHTQWADTAPADTLSLASRLAGAVDNYRWYLEKTVVPSDLRALYPYRAEPAFSLPELLTLLVFLAVTYHVVMGARRRPYAVVGWFWFLGMLFPVVGLFHADRYSYLADRFSYLPHLGLFLWLVWAAADLCERWSIPRLVRMALAGAVIGLLGWATIAQAGWWKDTRVMMERCWNFDSTTHRAANLLAIYYYWYQNDDQAAIDWGAKALAEAPGEPSYYLSQALPYIHLGKLDKAEELAKQLLRLPDDRENQLNAAAIYDALGQTYERLGRPEEAEKYLKRARELSAAVGGDR